LIVIKKNTGGEGLTCKDSTTNREKKNEQSTFKASRRQKLVRFELGDWVWVHIRNKSFPEQRRSKLMPRGDGPFQIIKKINDNPYTMDLPCEYGVSATFNIDDLFFFLM